MAQNNGTKVEMVKMISRPTHKTVNAVLINIKINTKISKYVWI